jgi:hypothetical protein
MDEILYLTGYLSAWIILYHAIIIPRTAQAAFNAWQSRLEEERDLIVNICEPLLEEIELIMDTKFQSFFGSVSQLGKRASDLNPANDMKKAIKSGDLYSVLAEYVANKAGIGDITSLIQPEKGEKQQQNRVGLGKL